MSSLPLPSQEISSVRRMPSRASRKPPWWRAALKFARRGARQSPRWLGLALIALSCLYLLALLDTLHDPHRKDVQVRLQYVQRMASPASAALHAPLGTSQAIRAYMDTPTFALHDAAGVARLLLLIGLALCLLELLLMGLGATQFPAATLKELANALKPHGGEEKHGSLLAAIGAPKLIATGLLTLTTSAAVVVPEAKRQFQEPPVTPKPISGAPTDTAELLKALDIAWQGRIDHLQASVLADIAKDHDALRRISSTLKAQDDEQAREAQRRRGDARRAMQATSDLSTKVDGVERAATDAVTRIAIVEGKAGITLNRVTDLRDQTLPQLEKRIAGVAASTEALNTKAEQAAARTTQALNYELDLQQTPWWNVNTNCERARREQLLRRAIDGDRSPVPPCGNAGGATVKVATQP